MTGHDAPEYPFSMLVKCSRVSLHEAEPTRPRYSCFIYDAFAQLMQRYALIAIWAIWAIKAGLKPSVFSFVSVVQRLKKRSALLCKIFRLSSGVMNSQPFTKLPITCSPKG